MREVLIVFEYVIGLLCVMGMAVLVGKLPLEAARVPPLIVRASGCKTCMSFWSGMSWGLACWYQGNGTAGFTYSLVAPFLFWLILLGRSVNAAL